MTQDLVESYCKRIRDTISPVIPRQQPLALVGFSETPDCGDHAVWLGEKALLAELDAGSLAYQCSASTYNRAEMAAKLKDGAILMHGGGLSPRASAREEFRLRVLSDFPGHPVIAFPGMISFAAGAALERSLRLLNSRENLCIFAETIAAEQLLVQHLGSKARVALAPDMAFLLGRQSRVQEALYDIVWIARTDQDRANDQTEAAARLSSQAAEKSALSGFEDGVEMSFVAKQRPPTVLLTDWSALVYDHVEARLALKRLEFDAQSRIYVSRAMAILSLGHVVITDRLHAHILCLLAGIPHVFLDTKSGSNANFYETWSRNAARCRWARSPAEAWTLARNAAAKLKELPADAAALWTWRDLGSE